MTETNSKQDFTTEIQWPVQLDPKRFKATRKNKKLKSKQGTLMTTFEQTMQNRQQKPRLQAATETKWHGSKRVNDEMIRVDSMSEMQPKRSAIAPD